MELIDVLDEEGNLTGKTKPRSEIHRDGDWHRSVHIWIINSEGKVLMQKRSPNKDSHPNEWDISSAGHVVAGDSSMGTVRKEIKEELGIEVLENDIQPFFKYKKQVVLNNGTFINNEWDDVYLIKSDVDISKIRLQTEEVSEVKWFTVDDLKLILENKTVGYVPHEEEYKRLIEHLEDKK